MRNLAILFLCVSCCAASGSETVYQTARDRVNHDQVSGNAFSFYGDEIILGGNARYLTNVAIGTQTFFDAATPEYTPAFIELTLYENDGAPDNAGDNGSADLEPHGQARPGTVIATTVVAGPTYPAGGVSAASGGIVVNFPLNRVRVPQRFTFAIRNLDANLQLDQSPSGYQWGPWLGDESLNANLVGTSKTAAGNTPQDYWIWLKYQDWESRFHGQAHGESALGNTVEATITGIALGDFNNLNGANSEDISLLELALTRVEEYTAANPAVADYAERGDINGDGVFNNFDLQPFEQLISSNAEAPSNAPVQSIVPEPGSLALLWFGAIAFTMIPDRRGRC